MHYCHCEHPIRIYNKYLNKYIFVPCRKCNSCNNIRSAAWTQRIKREMLDHEFVFHVTLKYDDNHVPYLVHDSVDNNVLVSHDIIEPSGKVVNDNIRISLDPVNDFEQDYYNSRLKFPYLRKRDIQLFIKSLRYEFSKIASYAKIRYVVCGEYGPRTFRSHYHLLLFIDSAQFAKALYSLLHKVWTKGSISARRCSQEDKAAGYVAKYVVRPADLPSLYYDSQIRQFFLSSKCPPIGTFSLNVKEVQEIFYESSPTFVLRGNSKIPSMDVPLWRCFESRLFPRLKGFDSINYFDRVRLYGLFDSFGQVRWSEFEQKFLDQYKKIPYVRDLYSPFLVREDNKEYNSLRNLFFISRRVCENCRLFNVSLRQHVLLIERYYSNKDYYKLCKQLVYEDDYIKNGGVDYDLITMDRNFYHDLIDEVEHDCLSQFTIDCLSQFDNLDIYSLPPVPVNLDTKSLVSDSLVLHKRSVKGKYANDRFYIDRFKTTISHFKF